MDNNFIFIPIAIQVARTVMVGYVIDLALTQIQSAYPEEYEQVQMALDDLKKDALTLTGEITGLEQETILTIVGGVMAANDLRNISKVLKQVGTVFKAGKKVKTSTLEKPAIVKDA